MIHAIILVFYLVTEVIPSIFYNLPIVVVHIYKDIRNRGIGAVLLSAAKALGFLIFMGAAMLAILIGGTWLLSLAMRPVLDWGLSSQTNAGIGAAISGFLLWFFLFKAGSLIKASEQETIKEYHREMEIRNQKSQA